MARKPYEWEVGSEPPEIEPHSIAKHEVLDGYLRRYLEVVTASRKVHELRITLVDGFAGGGLYRRRGTRQLHPGSPLRLLAGVAEAHARVEAHRGAPFPLDARYVFVEQRRKSMAHLEGVLRQSGFGPRIGADVELITGAFEQHVDAIITGIKQRSRSGRSIWLLDQYGYTAVVFATVRRIFDNLDKAEVLLTFSTDWLIDFLADTPAFEKALAKIGLPPRTLLDKKDGPDWRRAIQYELHRHIRPLTGASFYTPFFIESVNAHRSYWLLHLAKHPKANDVMKHLHWDMENHFAHYGGPGLQMLGYTAAHDAEVNPQSRFAFNVSARSLTRAALLDDLPGMLWAREGVPFGSLIEEITNDTPASSTIVGEVLLELDRAGTLNILGEKGGKRRVHDRIGAHDIIRPNRQLVIFPRSR